jgi:hypothetical protein
MRSQRDYNNPQQPGLVVPGMGPGTMPPAQPGFPPQQMTMPGGNYAPEPYPYGQMGAAFGGPGYVQGNFPQQSQGGWTSPGHNDPGSISDVMNPADADAAVDKYDSLISQLNGIDPELAEVKAGGVVATKSVDATYHELLRVIKLLEFPEEWIPPARSKYVESVRAGGKPIVDKLKNYSAQIAKLR